MVPPLELNYGDWNSDTAASTNVDIQGDTFTLATTVPDAGNLHARYDATELSLSDGQSVSTWPDETGNGHGLTDGGSPPTYQASALNGNPVVRFNGTDDFLSVAFSTLTQPNQIFAVIRFNSLPTDGAAYVYDGSSTSSDRHTYGALAGGSWRIFAGASLDGGSTDTNPHISNALFDGTGSKLDHDGASVVSGDAGTQGLNGFVVGGETGSNYASVDVGEVLIYPQDKTSVEGDVESYLSDKWGITV